MSQFISSFLIEPVRRQARRFSSLDFDSEQPQLEQPQSLPRPTESHHDTDESFPEYHEALASSPTEESFDQEDLDQETQLLEISRNARGDVTSAVDRAPSTQAAPSASSADTPHGRDRAEQALPQQTRDRHTSSPTADPPRTRAETDPRHPTTPPQPPPRFRSLYAVPTSLNESRLPPIGLRNPLRQSTDNTMSSGRSSSPLVGDSSLPEDDGMTRMRRRILAIQKLDAPAEEKSRMMHALMTEQYSLTRGDARSPDGLRPKSRESGSGVAMDRPVTPNSMLSTLDTLQPSPATSRTSMGDELATTAADRIPTYWEPPKKPGTANPSPEQSRKNSLDYYEDDRPLGCAHYRRNVKLQCYACSRWYTCRFCHDEVEDHVLNRRETRNMLCMLCGTAQPAAGECRKCGEVTACYYCDICKLWDDDPGKSIYHCDDCGICRVGEGLGKDFYHCKTCCVCLSISIRDTHRCIERSTDCDCPICGEYMFTSPQTVVFMRCGHSIHHACYKEHMQSSFKCPICSRSIMNMEMTFRHLTQAIENQPMPEQFKDTKALVHCNDCLAKTKVKYHWLGLKCGICDSYNTAQLQILSSPSGANPVDPSADQVADPALASPEAGPSDAPLTDTRGRILTVSAQAQPRRTATSASALENLRPPEANRGRVTRANSENNPHAQPFLVRSILNGSDSDSDVMDTDDDDLDFWGGESPRERARQLSREADNGNGRIGVERRSSGLSGFMNGVIGARGGAESEDDDDEDEDEDGSDSEDSDVVMDEDDDEEDEDDDMLKLPGHR